MSYKQCGNHNCALESLEDVIPLLAPNASCFQRIKRKFLEASMPSTGCHITKYHFKSVAALNAEKQRLLKRPSFIIHPFSTIAIWRKMIMAVVYMLHFIAEVKYLNQNKGLNYWVCVLMIIVPLKFSNVVISFMTGYEDKKFNKVILNKDKIVKKYLCTEFFVDIIDLHLGAIIINAININDELYYKLKFYFVAPQFIITLLRVMNFYESTRTILYFCTVPPRYQPIILHIIVSFLACLSFTELVFCSATGLAPHGFKSGNISEIFSGKSKTQIYIMLLHSVVCHMLHIPGFIKVENDYERITYSFILIFSFLIHVIVLMFIFTYIRKRGNAENTFEKINDQIKDYIKTKKIPPVLADKILRSFQQKYRKKFFNESLIISGLSDHLRDELWLNKCSHMIANSAILRGLPYSIVGRILANLEPVTFIPNEIIIKYKEEIDHLYFINRGICAVFTKEGKELYHLEDGDLIGITVFQYSCSSVNISSVGFAVVFKWNLREAFTLFQHSQDFRKKLIYSIRRRRREMSSDIALLDDQVCCNILRMNISNILENSLARKKSAYRT